MVIVFKLPIKYAEIIKDNDSGVTDFITNCFKAAYCKLY